MGDSFGLENVLWFANNKQDAFEEPTIKDQDLIIMFQKRS